MAEGQVVPSKIRACVEHDPLLLLLVVVVLVVDEPASADYLPVGFSTPNCLQIARARKESISLWRGTVVTALLAGFSHFVCLEPSSRNKQPCLRKCRSKSVFFHRLHENGFPQGRLPGKFGQDYRSLHQRDRIFHIFPNFVDCLTLRHGTGNFFADTDQVLFTFVDLDMVFHS